MTVDAIKDAISQLPEAERQGLAVWLNAMEYDAWDRQMVEDFSPAGRAAGLLERIEAEIEAGAFKPLEQGLRERKRGL